MQSDFVELLANDRCFDCTHENWLGVDAAANWLGLIDRKGIKILD